MTIYLVVYSDQECFSINKAFFDKEKAEEYCKEINKKEIKEWEFIASIHTVHELEVEA
jgi:hypothetical protein